MIQNRSLQAQLDLANGLQPGERVVVRGVARFWAFLTEPLLALQNPRLGGIPGEEYTHLIFHCAQPERKDVIRLPYRPSDFPVLEPNPERSFGGTSQTACA